MHVPFCFTLRDNLSNAQSEVCATSDRAGIQQSISRCRVFFLMVCVAKAFRPAFFGCRNRAGTRLHRWVWLRWVNLVIYRSALNAAALTLFEG